MEAGLDIDALLDVALGRLAGDGMDVTVRRERAPHVRADATLALRWGGSRQRFAVHAMASVRLAAVLVAVGETTVPVMVVAPWISPRIGAQLRELGVAYVDSVGNASVRFGTVLIEVSGRKRPGPEVELVETGSRQARPPGGARPPRTGRLLTPGNRRVIAALLDQPELTSAPLREVAAVAGVSVGQAHKSITLLARAGYHRETLDEGQRAALRGVLEAVGALDD